MNLRIAPSGLIFIAFWLFGLINNVLYVVNLSAAIDLVGPLVPKATVLLADVMPSFLIKLCAPFFVHVIPYKYVFQFSAIKKPFLDSICNAKKCFLTVVQVPGFPFSSY
jgi:battenin